MVIWICSSDQKHALNGGFVILEAAYHHHCVYWRWPNDASRLHPEFTGWCLQASSVLRSINVPESEWPLYMIWVILTSLLKYENGVPQRKSCFWAKLTKMCFVIRRLIDGGMLNKLSWVNSEYRLDYHDYTMCMQMLCPMSLEGIAKTGHIRKQLLGYNISKVLLSHKNINLHNTQNIHDIWPLIDLINTLHPASTASS